MSPKKRKCAFGSYANSEDPEQTAQMRWKISCDLKRTLNSPERVGLLRNLMGQ